VVHFMQAAAQEEAFYTGVWGVSTGTKITVLGAAEPSESGPAK
jgi:hypothetical protein